MNDDYKYRFYSPGKFFPTNLHYHTDDWFADKHGFSTLYNVDQVTAEAIKQEGTTAGFKGIVWSERLWIDIDNGEAADRAESKLNEMGLDYIAYFSGRSGAHFGILREHSPSHLLPSKDRAWVKKHFEQADLSIYAHLHLFRLPNTVHELTNQRKELIHHKLGNSLQYSREEEVANDSNSNGNVLSSNSSNSIFSAFRFMSEIKRLRSGDRHAALVRACYSLRDDANLKINEARFVLTELNKYFLEPKSEEEVEKIVRSIY